MDDARLQLAAADVGHTAVGGLAVCRFGFLLFLGRVDKAQLAVGFGPGQVAHEPAVALKVAAQLHVAVQRVGQAQEKAVLAVINAKNVVAARRGGVVPPEQKAQAVFHRSAELAAVGDLGRDVDVAVAVQVGAEQVQVIAQRGAVQVRDAGRGVVSPTLLVSVKRFS